MVSRRIQVTDATVCTTDLVCRPQLWPFLSFSNDIESQADDSDHKASNTEGRADYLVVGPSCGPLRRWSGRWSCSLDHT